METSRKQTQDIQNRIIQELETAPNTVYAFWSEFEIGVLKKYYGKKDTRLIAKLLNKPVGSVNRKASFLGLSFKK